MAGHGVFWLDANVYITAKDGPFRFNVNAGFWSFLDDQAKSGAIRSPKMVYDEIVANIPGADQLSKWVKNRKKTGLFVQNPNQAVQDEVRNVSNYVIGAFPQHHAAEFLRGADPFIIAHARESKGTVVTFETLAPANSRRIKIPNICSSFNVPYCNLYDMLEKLKAKFVKK